MVEFLGEAVLHRSTRGNACWKGDVEVGWGFKRMLVVGGASVCG